MAPGQQRGADLLARHHVVRGGDRLRACYVENATSAQIRYAIRRLRRKAPQAFILVSLIGAADAIDDQIVQENAKVAFVKQSLAETVERILMESTVAAQDNDIPLPHSKPRAMIS